MELTPWKPWLPSRKMGRYQNDMDRFLNRFFDDVMPDLMLEKEWVPRFNVSETKENLIIGAELPGLDAKDVDVNLTGDILTIKGEKKEEKKEDGEHYHCTEFHAGSFQRSYRLPTRIQIDKVDACFEKGVLKITLPKTEEAKEREINIEIH